MPHQKARKKKKKRERHQEPSQQEQQGVQEEKTGLREAEEFPQRLKIRKRRKKTGTGLLREKVSKHIKIILISFVWLLIVLYIVYKYTS